MNRFWIHVLLCLSPCWAGRCSSATDPVEPSDPSGDPEGVLLARTSVSTGLSYWLYRPEIPAGTPIPLMLYLHGSNRSGSDLAQVLSETVLQELEGGRNVPMIVVAPQCPRSDNWQTTEMTERLSRLVNEVVAGYGADPKRVLLTGFSMGGDAVWVLGQAHPEQFAALVPVGSWYRTTNRLCSVRDIPVWIFHGERDEVSPLAFARQMNDALSTCGGNVTLTVLAGANHAASSRMTFSDDALYAWLVAQVRP